MVGLTDNRRTAALLITSLIARLPLAMFSISLLVHVHRLTGSFTVAGAASGAYVIGRGLTSPLLGRLVDRHGQTLVLIGCAAASAILLVAVTLVPASSPDPLVLALSGMIGTVSPPLAACVRALLPVIASEPSALSAAYTLETTALELTFIAGPPLALGLATGLSTRASLLTGAIILLVATGAFAAQPASRHWHGRCTRSGRAASALRSPAIRTLAFLLGAVGIIFGAVDVAVAATASTLHAIGDAGPLLGIWGVGSLLGGIIATRSRASAHGAGALILLITALGAGHAALILGSESLPILAGLLLVAGASISPATGAIYALASRVAPSGRTTEAFAWLLSASATGASFGVAGAGALSQTTGPQAGFGLAAGAGALAVLIAIAGQRSLTFAPTREPQELGRAQYRVTGCAAPEEHGQAELTNALLWPPMSARRPDRSPDPRRVEEQGPELPGRPTTEGDHRRHARRRRSLRRRPPTGADRHPVASRLADRRSARPRGSLRAKAAAGGRAPAYGVLRVELRGQARA